MLAEEFNLDIFVLEPQRDGGSSTRVNFLHAACYRDPDCELNPIQLGL